MAITQNKLWRVWKSVNRLDEEVEDDDDFFDLI